MSLDKKGEKISIPKSKNESNVTIIKAKKIITVISLRLIKNNVNNYILI